MTKKKRLFIVLLAIILGITYALWSGIFRVQAWNTTGPYDQSRSFENGWATVVVNGPSGSSWLGLKFVAPEAGASISSDTFRSKARSINIVIDTHSEKNPYDLKVVTTTTTTKDNYSTGTNYSLVFFDVSYKKPAHEQFNEEKSEAKFTYESEGKFKSTAIHETTDKTVTVRLTVSVYSMGTTTHGSGSEIYREYGCKLTMGLKRNTYKVSYNGNGGTVSDSEKTYSCGAGFGNLPTASKKGYSFKQWNTKMDGSGTVITNNSSTCETKTVYAIWTAKQYKVSFDLNGVDGKINDLTAVYDKELTLPQNPYKIAGMQFLGWSKTKQDTSADYGDGAKIIWSIDKDTVLYAVWVKSGFKVTFYGNGATQENKISIIPYVEFSQETPTLTKSTFIREGYVFLGWSEDKDSKKIKYQDQEKVNFHSGDAVSELSLYAVWRKENANFTTKQIILDEDMFFGDVAIKGQNKTIYHSQHTDSEYARIDGENPGYFSKR